MVKLKLLVLFILVSVFANAQKELTSSVPRAVHSFDAAVKYYDAKNNKKALESLDDAIQADPKFIEAYMMKANIFTDMEEHEKAIAAYKDAIAINPDFFPNNFYSVAKEEFEIRKYEDAKHHLEVFLKYPKINGSIKFKAKRLLQNASFAAEAFLNPFPFEPINLGDSINSDNPEYFPTITADGKTLIFTRRLPTVTAYGTKTFQEDFYQSKLIDGKWSKARPVIEINTDGNEGAPALSSDGQYLFFTACKEDAGGNTGRPTLGSCDIFLARKKGDTFSKPINLYEPINSGGWESQPSFSSDGRTLYFVRKVKGSDNVSQYDIFVSRVGDNSEWSTPVPLNNWINTPYDEQSVFIHPDDQTLYFTSSGHPGMGGEDIYYSRKDSAGNWGPAVNVGYPINSPNDENSLLVSPDGTKAFFASDRPGGKGGLDLYQFDLYPKARPIPVTYMKGKVYDAETKAPLESSFELIDLATSKIVVSSTSNPVSGEFLVTLPTGKKYALNVSKENYLFYSENFQLVQDGSSKEPFLKDVPLQPIKIGGSIVLKNIFFDFDKFELKSDSRVELNKLVAFLNKHPKVKFEIQGHTDNVGGKEYNQKLSEQRAKSVYDYLLTQGITADRMTSKGYGDTKPVVSNATDAGKAQNRRTEFVVTGVN